MKLNLFDKLVTGVCRVLDWLLVNILTPLVLIVLRIWRGK